MDNTKKRDSLSFVLALIINILIVLVIPNYKIEDIKEGKLKVGLVALEKNNYKGNTKAQDKNVKPKEKTVTKAETKPEVKPKPVVTPPVVKKEEAKPKETKAITKEETKTIVKEEIKKPVVEEPKIDEAKLKEIKEKELKAQKSLALENISKTIKAPKLDVISTVNQKDKKVNDVLNTDEIGVKKQVAFERKDEGRDVDIPRKEIESTDNIILENQNNNEILTTNNKSQNISNEINSEIISDEIIPKGKIEGLPSGYKLGLTDGDIIARWDTSNAEPKYPEAAELRGLQGSVRVKIDVNERGEVVNVAIDKGSGVPEINTAIESIARTWKIYLSKHGLSVKGRVILDYTFKLKANF